MSETSPRLNTIDLSQLSPELRTNKPVLATILTLVDATFHGENYFEYGAEEEIRHHRDLGGSFIILLTHYRHADPVVMGKIARRNESLRFLQYTTRVAAKRDLFHKRLYGFIIRSCCQPFDRSIEHPYETLEQKEERREKNQKAIAVLGQVIEAGGNCLILPEGGSKDPVLDDFGQFQYDKDGKMIRVPRRPGVLQEIQNGFVYVVEGLSTEARERTQFLAVAVNFGNRLFSNFRATSVVSRPEPIIDGPSEDIKLQGVNLLHRTNELVNNLDAWRSQHKHGAFDWGLGNYFFNV